jgi:hypothetical protein
MRCLLFVIFVSFYEQAKYSSTIWMIMSHLGYDFLDELNGPLIHHLENVMTMDVTTHRLFDQLEFYLEKTVSKCCEEHMKTLIMTTVNSEPIPTNGFQSMRINAVFWPCHLQYYKQTSFAKSEVS